MDSSIYAKTELGHETIQTRNQSLSRIERSVLIMIDGRKTGAEIVRMSAAIGAERATLERLIELGMVQATVTLTSAKSAPLAPPTTLAAQPEEIEADEPASAPELLSDSQLDRELEAMLREPISASPEKAKAFSAQESSFSKTAEFEPAANKRASMGYANDAERMTVICDTLQAEIKLHLGLRGMDLTVRAGNAVTVEALKSVADDLVNILKRRKERGAAALAESVEAKLDEVFDTPTQN
jgi:hypothetical protein